MEEDEAEVVEEVQEEEEDGSNADMETRLQQLFEALNRDALRLQSEYYSERRHLRDLDQQRRAALADIVGPN